MTPVSQSPDDIVASMRARIGRESEPVRSPGPIEWSDVRRYMNATGDVNPLWGAADLASNPSRAGSLAPPAMILDVLRPEPDRDIVDDRGERGFPSLGGLAATIAVPGERGRLNASTDVEWMRPLHIGDWLTVTFTITDVTLKQGRTGPAVFITEERRYADQRGQPIALVRQVTVRLLGPS